MVGDTPRELEALIQDSLAKYRKSKNPNDLAGTVTRLTQMYGFQIKEFYTHHELPKNIVISWTQSILQSYLEKYSRDTHSEYIYCKLAKILNVELGFCVSSHTNSLAVQQYLDSARSIIANASQPENKYFQ